MNLPLLTIRNGIKVIKLAQNNKLKYMNRIFLRGYTNLEIT